MAMANRSDERVRRIGHSARQMRQVATAAEKLLWKYLRNRHAGGFKFRRQQSLGPFVADFFCAEAKLIVEVDGAVHALREEMDAERSYWLEEGKLHVFRFRNGQVLSGIHGVVAEIVALCVKRSQAVD